MPVLCQLDYISFAAGLQSFGQTGRGDVRTKKPPRANLADHGGAVCGSLVEPAAQVELPDDPDDQAGADDGDDDLADEAAGLEADQAEGESADQAADQAQNHIAQPAVGRAVLHELAAEIKRGHSYKAPGTQGLAHLLSPKSC